MTRWLPIHVRRFIAVLLLLLDLGLEPGSALSFVGMSDPEDDAVADLCRQDDFWWGKASAIGESANFAQTSADCGARTGPEQATQHVSTAQLAFVPPNVEAVLIAPDIPLLARGSPELDLLPFDRHSLHRNTYVAQKRDIVLIL